MEDRKILSERDRERRKREREIEDMYFYAKEIDRVRKIRYETGYTREKDGEEKGEIEKSEMEKENGKIIDPVESLKK